MPAPAALPPVADPGVSSADLLFNPGRAASSSISAALKILVGLCAAGLRAAAVVGVLSTAATIGLIVSVSFFAWRLFVLMKRRLLWRVRRKLILSYIFIGVVPSLLIVIFFLLGGVLIFMNVSAYLFKDGYDAMVDDVKLFTESAASEMSRSPDSAEQSFARIHRNASRPYPVLSFVYVPIPRAPAGPRPQRRARPRHRRTPAIPSASGSIGRTVGAHAGAGIDSGVAAGGHDRDDRAAVGRPAREVELVIRAAQPVVTDGALAGFVIADLPIGLEMVQKLQEETRVRAGTATVLGENADTAGHALRRRRTPPTAAAGGPRSSGRASSFSTTTTGRPASRGA